MPICLKQNDFARDVVRSISRKSPVVLLRLMLKRQLPHWIHLFHGNQILAVQSFGAQSHRTSSKDLSRLFSISFEHYQSVMTVRLLRPHFSVCEVSVVLTRLRN
jgi:hypothetical protein